MKSSKLVYVAVAVAGIALSPTIRADEAKPSTPPSREELREKFQNLSPEEREAKRKEFMEKRSEEMNKTAKEIGLDPEALKKLSPEDRRAKIKEAVDKKIAELQKKKEDGSISDSDKELLRKLEMRKRMAENFRQGGRGPGGARPEKPADK